jgi:putative two-component system response regulator
MAKELQPDAIRILLTGYSDLESLVKCVNEAGIYKYMTKPWEPGVLKLTVDRALEHLDVARKLKLASEQLKDAYLSAITMLSIACEGKDEATSFHVRRVQRYTEALARELGQADEAAQHMGVMSILHDIGKLGIPDSILKKPDKLDEEEWHIMKGHAAHGVRILGSNPFYAIAREIAGSHHENWDGTGYPLQQKGYEIPLPARIVRVADVFDALTSRRPYKEPWSIERSLTYLREQSGRQFDPTVIQAFFKLHELGMIEKIIETNSYQEHTEKL